MTHTASNYIRHLTFGVGLCSAAIVLLAFATSSHADDSIPLPFQYQIQSPIDTSRNGDPIAPLADRMGDVVIDLTSLKTDQPVQTKQKQIVSSLDQLIAELEKQCSSSGGANPNPTRPMQRSQITGGPGGSGPLHDPNAGTRVWGQLPPKERDQILQSQTEGFPPGYESVLASYYTHLSQNQADTGATTQPATP
jgi:hypothetical protein